jgi:hypothetical protein
MPLPCLCLQVFPLGSALVHNISVAILKLTQENEASKIEHKWLNGAALTTGNDSPVADSAPLTVQSLSGLFVITGCVSTLMLFIRIAMSVYTRCTRVPASVAEDDRSTNLGETSDMGCGSAPSDQSLSEESSSEHSIRAHGGSVSIGQEDPCQIHNGSVPADSLQIEMRNAET